MFKIASPLILMVLSIIAGIFVPNFLFFTNTEIFSEEMLIFIVLLVLGDAFILKLKDLKENYVSIIYLAGISVAMAVILGTLSKFLIFPDLDIQIGALIALFAMVTATDPVSVVAVFNQYKLPHKLKILAEGESLFNDAMALTLFSAFGLYLMNDNILTISYGITVSFEIFIGSTIIGILTGIIGLLILKQTKDLLGEFVLILLIAYSSFLFAEHIHIIGDNHLSGLLSEIVAILTMTTFIDKSYEIDKKRFKQEKNIINKMSSHSKKHKKFTTNKILNSFISDITDIKRQQDIYKFINVISLLANGVLFVSMAHIINFETLKHYWVEILLVFGITTLIRAFLIGVLSISSYHTKLIPNIDFKWYSVLLFAGIKGGLSIVMLHMLNIAFPTFEYKELFESIVIGVILLSTFIYVPLMMITIKLNKHSFMKELLNEKH
jgi:CPA1 family monovalent cation:H+ antiporter